MERKDKKPELLTKKKGLDDGKMRGKQRKNEWNKGSPVLKDFLKEYF